MVDVSLLARQNKKVLTTIEYFGDSLTRRNGQYAVRNAVMTNL
ncbi:hypothetical protein YTCETSXE_CDS0021 [Staphylococcus phage MVC_VPHSA2]|nr:hypothetical protein YTCETSXE_CDS0021 [Staphylococcus phage MVC_VPHSA2]